MSLQIITGDCRVELKKLPDKSVQCCVTSPPYWGLRDYGTAKWEGGDSSHPHDRIPARNGRGGSGSPGKQTVGAFPSDLPAIVCSCGARRIDSQIGLEATPEAYVETMRGVFREVWRVLRDDGTLWLNLGSSYASSPAGNTTWNHGECFNGRDMSGHQSSRKSSTVTSGYKPKDLIPIPWLVAMALQQDGWYLRSDIIWHKPNPMPESVTDRPTKSHEYIFLLTKREKYYYDAGAIAEPMTTEDYRRPYGSPGANALDPRGHQGNGELRRYAGKATKDFEKGNAQDASATKARIVDHIIAGEITSRNKRSVWTVTTKPYSEVHFATFPPDLIKPCILAGTKPGDVVIDPFGGSGTTGMVALELGRSAILIELNPDYTKLCDERCNVTAGLPLE